MKHRFILKFRDFQVGKFEKQVQNWPRRIKTLWSFTFLDLNHGSLWQSLVAKADAKDFLRNAGFFILFTWALGDLAWWESETYYHVFNVIAKMIMTSSWFIISQSLINLYIIHTYYVFIYIYMYFQTCIVEIEVFHSYGSYRSYWGAVQPWWIFGRAEIDGGYLGWPAQTFWKQFHGGLPFLKLAAKRPWN